MAISSLAKRLLKTQGKESLATIMTDSKYKTKTPVATTPVSIINGMLSGDLRGGIIPGVTILLGDSRTFKCFDGDTKITVYVEDSVYDRLKGKSIYHPQN